MTPQAQTPLTFTDAELAYIGTQQQSGAVRLAHVATATPDGRPHVVPMRAVIGDGGSTVLVLGIELASTYKYRQVQKNPGIAIVWDSLDAAGIKGIEVRGTAVIRQAPGDRDPHFEVTPTKVFSWGINEPAADSFEQKMGMDVSHLRR